MPENQALKVRGKARASKVLVTKADGSQEVQNAYNKFELERIQQGKKRRRRKKQPKKKVFVTKNSKGELVACGDVALMRIGMRVRVHDPVSKRPEMRMVLDLGKPFNRKGRELVYGYFRQFKTDGLTRQERGS